MNRSTEPLALRARCLIDEGAGADADASVMMNDGLPRAGNFAMTVLSDMTCRRNSPNSSLSSPLIECEWRGSD